MYGLTHRVSSGVLCIFLLLAGCSKRSDRPELGQVQGTVTLDGKPLVSAAVIFMPQPGRASRGKTDKEGHYELTYIRDILGAKLGTNNVRISTYGEAGPVELVPAKYNRQTTLAEEVKPGKNTFDFALESSLESSQL